MAPYRTKLQLWWILGGQAILAALAALHKSIHWLIRFEGNGPSLCGGLDPERVEARIGGIGQRHCRIEGSDGGYKTTAAPALFNSINRAEMFHGRLQRWRTKGSGIENESYLEVMSA